jgi:hypothetical protein
LLEPSIGWDWTERKDGDSLLHFGDVMFLAIHNWYEAKEISTTFAGRYFLFFPTAPWSRAEGKILFPKFEVQSTSKYHDQKGAVIFRIGFGGAIRRYTTPEPTATDQTAFDKLEDDKIYTNKGDGAQFEILDPYQKYGFDFSTKIQHHLFTDKVNLELKLVFAANKKYDQRVTYEDAPLTIVESPWEYKMEMRFPRFFITPYPGVEIQAYMETSGPIASWRPYSTEEGNSLSWQFRLKYSF